MVVLEQGDLARAMRASMSVPAVFSPIKIDGRLLVDGGLVRNLPVDVARQMGADVIIAVDVGGNLAEQEELGSIAKLTGQIVSLMIRRNVEAQYPQADVVIRPDLEGFRSMDFERTLEMVPRGSAAARELAAVLSQYSLDEEDFRKHQERMGKARRRPGVLASVQLTVESTADPRLVLDKVRSRPGDALDVEAIRRDLESLYELGDYERVDFFLTPAEQRTATKEGDQDPAALADESGWTGIDAYDLHIEAHEKSWGPSYLRFGVGLSADLEGESGFNVGTSYTMTRLNRRRGELKLEAQLGEDLLLAAKYYQPFDRAERWFVAPWIDHSTRSVDLAVSEDAFAEYRVDQLRGGIDLGLGLGKYGEVRLGATVGEARGKLRKGPDLIADRDVGWGGYQLRAVIDQFDDPNFPREGYLLALEAFAARESLGADDRYDRLTVLGGTSVSAGNHTLLALAELNTALGSELPFYDRFALGGLFELSGLRFDSIEGQYGGVGALIYSYRVLQLPSTIGEGIYAGCSVEAGNLWEAESSVSPGDLRYSGSIFVGADTLLGPAYLGLGLSDSGESAWYLYIGRVF
jgi:NTE family protein